MTYLSRAALLAAATELVEQDIYVLQLGGTIRIRELTGMQRHEASRAAFEAARTDGMTDADVEPDNDMYRAMIVVFGTVEPALTIDDVPALKAGRFGAIDAWANQIFKLSEALPGSLKSGGAADDARQRRQKKSPGTTGEETQPDDE